MRIDLQNSDFTVQKNKSSILYAEFTLSYIGFVYLVFTV
ncbi:hypothetical protein LEP1GSC132_0455 [Leptospira kirschneri str. 200803703]|nr:hypothetical protein LEP1GSC132_0455 [Leptospira kirschneri str. 200803703]